MDKQIDKQKIIETAAKKAGVVRSMKILTECAITLASSLIQRDNALGASNYDEDLYLSLNEVVNQRIADILIAIDMCAYHGRKEEIRKELNRELVRMDVQNLSKDLTV